MDLKKEAPSITKLLQSFKLVKISRKANVVAHELAKFSFDNLFDGTLVSSSVPPSWCIL